LIYNLNNLPLFSTGRKLRPPGTKSLVALHGPSLNKAIKLAIIQLISV